MKTYEKDVLWGVKKLSKSIDINLNYPWRKEKTPYKIFLSEILLIRTRADLVLKIFPYVIERYPSIRDLALAKKEDLEELLKPLGLTDRSSRIIQAASYVQEEFDGVIPYTVNDLQNIPGIGKYTSGAIMNFGFDEKNIPADVNIFRFLSRYSGLDIGHKTKGSPELYELIDFILRMKTNIKAEILIDFTRSTCKPRNPFCLECLINQRCTYFNNLSL